MTLLRYMRRRGARVLGPYANRGHFRVVVFDAQRRRSAHVFETKDEALRYIELCRVEFARSESWP